MFSECLCGAVMTWELSFTFRSWANAKVMHRVQYFLPARPTSITTSMYSRTFRRTGGCRSGWWNTRRRTFLYGTYLVLLMSGLILICISRSLPFSYLSNAPAYFRLDGLVLYQWSCINLVIRVLCFLCGVHVSVWHAAQKDVNGSHHPRLPPGSSRRKKSGVDYCRSSFRLGTSIA